MFNNSLDNDTYADNLISNNANLIDYNSDIITPNNLEINSFSNAMDSLLTAKELGTLSNKQSEQGNVSRLDRRDFYHFSTDKIGDLDYRLTGLSSNANIQLLDSDGDMLSGSFKPGKANEYKVHHNLPAGEYYLKVYGFNTNYNLDFELLGDPDAMNSFLTAKDFGTLSGKQTQQGTVSKEDRLDLYHFRTDETGDLEYNLTGLSNNANIQLLDSDGDMLSGSFKPGKADEYKVHQDLVAGDYYLKVYGGGTDYNLDIELLGEYDFWDDIYELVFGEPAEAATLDALRKKEEPTSMEEFERQIWWEKQQQRFEQGLEDTKEFLKNTFERIVDDFRDVQRNADDLQDLVDRLIKGNPEEFNPNNINKDQERIEPGIEVETFPGSNDGSLDGQTGEFPDKENTNIRNTVEKFPTEVNEDLELPFLESSEPWRGTPAIQDGDSKKGWQHIYERHVTGSNPGGDLFAPGTTRTQVQDASENIIKKGTRISNPSRRLQSFEDRITINGKRDRVRVTVDSYTGDVITVFPVRSE